MVKEVKRCKSNKNLPGQVCCLPEHSRLVNVRVPVLVLDTRLSWLLTTGAMPLDIRSTPLLLHVFLSRQQVTALVQELVAVYNFRVLSMKSFRRLCQRPAQQFVTALIYSLHHPMALAVRNSLFPVCKATCCIWHAERRGESPERTHYEKAFQGFGVLGPLLVGTARKAPHPFTVVDAVTRPYIVVMTVKRQVDLVSGSTTHDRILC